MTSHKLVPLTSNLACHSPSGKTPIFPHYCNTRYLKGAKAPTIPLKNILHLSLSLFLTLSLSLSLSPSFSLSLPLCHSLSLFLTLSLFFSLSLFLSLSPSLSLSLPLSHSLSLTPSSLVRGRVRERERESCMYAQAESAAVLNLIAFLIQSVSQHA
jgi:hypothetical protein